MGTKNEPGTFDCWANAEPDEPMFVLLARDKQAPDLVRKWATDRNAAGEEPEVVNEAFTVADAMENWRAAHRPPPINTMNDFLVGTNGDTYSIMAPVALMTREEAIRTAAWLVALADPFGIEFAKVLEAVSRT